MSAELEQLAQVGAAAIVSAMATDVWGQLRLRLAKAFGRGSIEREQVALQTFDESFVALSTADPIDAAETTRDLEGEIRGQLKLRLREDRVFAAEFAALLEEIKDQISTSGHTGMNVTQRAKADRGSTIVQAGGSIAGPGWKPARRGGNQ